MIDLGAILTGMGRRLADTALASFLERRRKNAFVTDFPEPDDGGYNAEFYTYFTAQIAAARKTIYVTGDGFTFRAGKEGLTIARGYNDAFRTALDNGVEVVRLQTQSVSDPRWVEMLAGLLDDYPDLFSLYLLNGSDQGQLVSTCVIDPHDRKRCVVEIMLTTQMIADREPTGIAGTAIFLHRSTRVGLHLANKILATCRNSDQALRVMTRAEAMVQLPDSVLYFAFGSNMDTVQLTERVGDVTLRGIGVLNDHSIAFNRAGSYRAGSVASATPSPGNAVYGVLWEMSQDQLRRLDQIEDPTAYRREARPILDASGATVFCGVHIAIPQADAPPPDAAYLTRILAAARHHALPETYVAQLERHRAS